MLNLIFLGPPGAGKGTQAKAIVDNFGIPQVSTGDMIRAAIKEGTPSGKEFQSYTNRGALVPDDVINKMVEERLSKDDCKNGVLLDGFPRTIVQAEALIGIFQRLGNRQLHHVLLLQVPDQVIEERITGRRSDPETGDIYHMVYNKPPADIADRLIQRKDDTAEVVQQRLKEYHDVTAALVPFYEKEGLIRSIDGTSDIDAIGKQIKDILS